jgi:hypothetical protein
MWMLVNTEMWLRSLEAPRAAPASARQRQSAPQPVGQLQ